MSDQIDLNYRPNTYWPESLNQEQLLTRIPGQVRRDIVRRLFAEDGNAGLDALAANEDFGNEDRRNWGLEHPSFMGGEYLPQMGVGDVELARISLASVTSDQISIRASHAGEKIRYAVLDEYPTHLARSFSVSRPLGRVEAPGEVVEENERRVAVASGRGVRIAVAHRDRRPGLGDGGHLHPHSGRGS